MNKAIQYLLHSYPELHQTKHQAWKEAFPGEPFKQTLGLLLQHFENPTDNSFDLRHLSSFKQTERSFILYAVSLYYEEETLENTLFTNKMISSSAFARMLGITRQAFYKKRISDGLPSPDAYIDGHPVWNNHTAERFAEAQNLKEPRSKNKITYPIQDEG